jgi:toxin YoeB
MRTFCFAPEVWAQPIHLHGQDGKTLERANMLIDAVARDLFSGIGKPEPLAGNLLGYWSGRINETLDWRAGLLMVNLWWVSVSLWRLERWHFGCEKINN